MGGFTQKIFKKEDPSVYQDKDSHLERTLRVRDVIALGVGTIVSTAIFTLPGIVAAQHAGPAVVISFILAAVVAALVSFAYAEMSSTMPYAGSAYSWINVVFGEVFGWIAGWALLAEYIIAAAFVASGFSANLRGLISPLGIQLPDALTHTLGASGGIIDIIAAIVIILTAILLSFGVSEAARVENILVVLKVFAVLLFIVVGLTVVHPENYVPFIPEYKETANGAFGGWQGIYAGGLNDLPSLHWLRLNRSQLSRSHQSSEDDATRNHGFTHHRSNTLRCRFTRTHRNVQILRIRYDS